MRLPAALVRGWEARSPFMSAWRGHLCLPRPTHRERLRSGLCAGDKAVIAVLKQDVEVGGIAAVVFAEEEAICGIAGIGVNADRIEVVGQIGAGDAKPE